MKWKYIAASLAGACAEAIAVIVLWNYTKIDIFGIVFWAFLAFIAGACIALEFSNRIESKRKRRNRKCKGAQIITLNREEWERGKRRMA